MPCAAMAVRGPLPKPLTATSLRLRTVLLRSGRPRALLEVPLNRFSANSSRPATRMRPAVRSAKSARGLVQKGARLAFDQDRNEVAHGPLTEGSVCLGYSRFDLFGRTRLVVGARETFDDSADGVFLARLDSHDVPCLKDVLLSFRWNCYAEAPCPADHYTWPTAYRGKPATPDGPEERGSPGSTAGPCPSRLRGVSSPKANRAPDGTRRAPEVVFETPDGAGGEVQVNVLVRMEVDDLVLDRAQCPPRATAWRCLREVRPTRQLRHGAQGHRHVPIMPSSPRRHHDLGKP